MTAGSWDDSWSHFGPIGSGLLGWWVGSKWTEMFACGWDFYPAEMKQKRRGCGDGTQDIWLAIAKQKWKWKFLFHHRRWNGQAIKKTFCATILSQKLSVWNTLLHQPYPQLPSTKRLSGFFFALKPQCLYPFLYLRLPHLCPSSHLFPIKANKDKDLLASLTVTNPSCRVCK